MMMMIMMIMIITTTIIIRRRRRRRIKTTYIYLHDPVPKVHLVFIHIIQMLTKS